MLDFLSPFPVRERQRAPARASRVLPLGQIFTLLACCGCSAAASTLAVLPDAEPGARAQSSAPAPQAAAAELDSRAGEGLRKSYLVPIGDILGFQFLLNEYDRHFEPEDVYETDLSTISTNLHSGWVIDHDPFATNQFLHPVQGSIYHGFSRSAGLDYWESLGYDFGASALWEIAGETDPPSLNDQLTTSFAGSFLGEALFRMANYLLEQAGPKPGFLCQLAATVVSPSSGFNRLAFGDRFARPFVSHDPATYTRIGVGVRRNERVDERNVQREVPRDELVGDFVMDYGLPGRASYDYLRPFDYFHFEASAASSTSALPEDVQVRGLLVGTQYHFGGDYRGVWGLYGGYDYISPEVFSVSSTFVSLGTTAQWRLGDSVALQGTALAGLGWTAVGTVADAAIDRTYHYGVSPQTQLALRVLWSDICVLDMTGRDYYIGNLFDAGSEDSDIVLRGKVALTFRVWGHNAVGVQYVASSREARFSGIPDEVQTIGALSLFYTYISDTKFGAVDWR